MSIVVFRSRAAGEIVMMGDTAQRLLALIGKPMTERGVIPVNQLADAIERLTGAVEQEKRLAGTRQEEAGAGDGDLAAEPPVGLAQRAFPLVAMLRAAQRFGADVTWGV